jgi:hypothetical protein
LQRKKINDELDFLDIRSYLISIKRIGDTRSGPQLNRYSYIQSKNFQSGNQGVTNISKKGKAQESSWEGVPWLVSLRNLATTFLYTIFYLMGFSMFERVSHTSSEKLVV